MEANHEDSDFIDDLDENIEEELIHDPEIFQEMRDDFENDLTEATNMQPQGHLDRNNETTLFTKYTCRFLAVWQYTCLLYTSPSPRDATLSRMPSSA